MINIDGVPCIVTDSDNYVLIAVCSFITVGTSAEGNQILVVII
jgi:hypothetical protein